MNLDLLDEAIEYSLETRRSGAVKDWEFNSMMSEGNLAVIFNVLGRHDEALDAAERADSFRPYVQRGFYGYTIGGAVGPKTLALAAVGSLADAKAYLNDRLPDLAELRMPLLLNSVVIFVAALAGVSGDWERCAVLHASTTTAGAFFRDSLGFTIYRFYEGFIDDHLPPEERDAAFARGGQMSLQEALAYGLEVERQVTTAI